MKVQECRLLWCVNSSDLQAGLEEQLQLQQVTLGCTSSAVGGLSGGRATEVVQPAAFSEPVRSRSSPGMGAAL